MVQLDTFITTPVGLAILIYVGYCMYRGGIHIRTMVDGKRPWKRELKVRYDALVGNTFGNTQPIEYREGAGITPKTDMTSQRSLVRIHYRPPSRCA